MFDKFWYDDATIGKEPEGYDLTNWKNKIVKVIVTNKTNPYRFDKFIENLEKVGVIDMQIVEDHFNHALEDDSTIVNEAESTIDIFKHHIEQISVIGHWIEIIRMRPIRSPHEALLGASDEFLHEWKNVRKRRGRLRGTARRKLHPAPSCIKAFEG